MKMSSPFIDELTREAETTRRVLERVPQEKRRSTVRAQTRIRLPDSQTPGRARLCLCCLKTLASSRASRSSVRPSTLTRLLGLTPTVPLGLTDACRMVLRGGQPMTPVEVRDRLVHRLRRIEVRERPRRRAHDSEAPERLG
jgi:hypothetical protein